MTYYLSLCSPETYQAFSESDRQVTGFRSRHQNAAARVKIGDKLIFYLTKLSRWCGIAEVTSEWFHDETPRYQEIDDPYIVRLNVKVVAWLSKDKAIPIHDERVWDRLTFTSGIDPKSNRWTGKVRTSLTQLDFADGEFLERFILAQAENGEIFEFDQAQYNKLMPARVRSVSGFVAVSIPESEEDATDALALPEVRESIKIQASVAKIGAEMGMQIWIPRNDKAAVLREAPSLQASMLDILPLNYDDATIRTVEQIDVLWLRRRSIVRAFEVEHTTSIYSGILRMADLMALQPNLSIKAHIVAPSIRREKVLQEIQRPVFTLLESGPLAGRCTYLSYESVVDLEGQKLLSHLSDSVLDEYAELADEAI